MIKSMLCAAAAVLSLGVPASGASATVYLFSVSELGGPTYDFSLDSTTGASPGTRGLVTNFTNVAYTTNGVASGTTSVSFSDRNIGADPFTLILSGTFNLGRFAIGAGPNVSFLTGTFSAIDFATVVPVNGISSDNVVLRISTPTINGAVPEPATWAMMVAGFGAIGFGMRGRRKPSTSLQIA